MPANPLLSLIRLFSPSTIEIRNISSSFQAAMDNGLAGDGHGSIKMLPSFVSRPRGDEQGEFISLDLGGTNVRAFLASLKGNHQLQVTRQDSFRLKKRTGTARDLFNPVTEFVAGLLDKDQEYNLGFIFAFPIEQAGIKIGKLINWTKELEFAGVVGNDVVKLLEDSFKENYLKHEVLKNVTVSALANDTVGVLMTGAYLEPSCDIGLIVATGTNMAVTVSTDQILRPVQRAVGNLNEVIINTECGNFNGVDQIQTEYDQQLDEESNNKGEQLLEKQISGLYLGELVRYIICDLSSSTQLFLGWKDQAEAFSEPYKFGTEYMSEIAFDSTRALFGIDMLLRRLGIAKSSLAEREALKQICHFVARRSARLVTAALSAALLKIDPYLEKEHVIAVDGSVYRGYPGYHDEVLKGLKDLLGKEESQKIQTVFIKDSSGVGAAVIAAVAANNPT
jgi:hexokinase